MRKPWAFLALLSIFLALPASAVSYHCYTGIAKNPAGTLLTSASVTVNTYAGALATIYSDEGSTTTGNPLTADASTASFTFCAADGRYRLAITKSGNTYGMGVTIEAGAATGGNSFETIDAPSGTDPVADSPTDTLTLTCSGGLTCTGTAATDTLALAIGTLNQNTTGSAATLTTPRAIYGNNFDGSADVTGPILAPSGTSSNPGISFSADATAGWVLNGAGDITLWVNGSGAVRWGYGSSNRTYFIGYPVLTNPHTPSSSAESCVEGSMARDDSYFYVCRTNGLWGRTALETGW